MHIPLSQPSLRAADCARIPRMDRLSGIVPTALADEAGGRGNPRSAIYRLMYGANDAPWLTEESAERKFMLVDAVARRMHRGPVCGPVDQRHPLDKIAAAIALSGQPVEVAELDR